MSRRHQPRPRRSTYKVPGEARNSRAPMLVSEIGSLEAPIWERIPHTKDDWMNFLVARIRRKAGGKELKYVSDEDIAHSIELMRATLRPNKEAKIDPDMPDCYYWSIEQTAEWISQQGFPEVKQMFLKNYISGRKLVQIDASALNQMGLRDLSRMSLVTFTIRNLLGIPAPNALRAIMRLVPVELFLTQKARTGLEIDLLSFKKFCEKFGFPYEFVLSNKTLSIPPDCVVQIKANCVKSTSTRSKMKRERDGASSQSKSNICDESGESSQDSSSDDEESLNSSINYAPSVEFIVRSKPQRDHIIRHILNKVIGRVLAEIADWEAQLQLQLEFEKAKAKGKKVAVEMEARVREIFSEGFSQLGIDREGEGCAQERVEFIALVSEELVDDILRTREILMDIEKFSNYMENSLEPHMMLRAQRFAQEVFEQVSPIATLLAYGQLDLETLVREAPRVKEFVQDVIQTAEDEVALRQALRGVNGSKDTGRDVLLDVLSDEKMRLAEVAWKRISVVETARKSRTLNLSKQNSELKLPE